MPKTLEEQLLETIEKKRELLMRISTQMQPDVENKVLSEETIQQHRLALDNLDASAISLGRGDHEKTLHFFSRACSNMGEFKGRSDKERGRP